MNLCFFFFKFILCFIKHNYFLQKFIKVFQNQTNLPQPVSEIISKYQEASHAAHKDNVSAKKKLKPFKSSASLAKLKQNHVFSKSKILEMQNANFKAREDTARKSLAGNRATRYQDKLTRISDGRSKDGHDAQHGKPTDQRRMKKITESESDRSTFQGQFSEKGEQLKRLNTPSKSSDVEKSIEDLIAEKRAKFSKNVDLSTRKLPQKSKYDDTKLVPDQFKILEKQMKSKSEYKPRRQQHSSNSNKKKSFAGVPGYIEDFVYADYKSLSENKKSVKISTNNEDLEFEGEKQMPINFVPIGASDKTKQSVKKLLEVMYYY